MQLMGVFTDRVEVVMARQDARQGAPGPLDWFERAGIVKRGSGPEIVASGAANEKLPPRAGAVFAGILWALVIEAWFVVVVYGAVEGWKWVGR